VGERGDARAGVEQRRERGDTERAANLARGLVEADGGREALRRDRERRSTRDARGDRAGADPEDLETLARTDPAVPDEADGRRRRGNATRESILQAAPTSPPSRGSRA
jgi:hypothetical protein